jgi:Cft2 family RNA processing exonuclease
MAKLTVISGQGGKLPAAFLLEMNGRRLLLDLGEGPQPGVRPDVSGVGHVDAICLSHAHIDHVGALDLASQLGNPQVYATAPTWGQIDQALVSLDRRHVLPVKGPAEIAGLPVILGRSGHSPGGIWMHFQHDGGFLYTGDWSAESLLLPFDMPPPASCVVTDASYGDRNTSLNAQIQSIAAFAAEGAVLCVPPGGRGPEMALAIASHGFPVFLCPTIRQEMVDLAADTLGLINEEKRHDIACLLNDTSQSSQWLKDQIIVAAGANGEAGLAATLLSRRDEGFRFLFSGHVPDGTPAADLLQAGQAHWLPWNVHPRLSDTLALVERTGASRVIAAFAPVRDMPLLREKLGDRFCHEPVMEFHMPERLVAQRAGANR